MVLNETSVGERLINPIGEAEADITEDLLGWFTLARLRYRNGTQYDVVVSEECTADEFDILVKNYLPRDSIYLGATDSETFGGVGGREVTLSWWVME